MSHSVQLAEKIMYEMNEMYDVKQNFTKIIKLKICK